MPHFEIKFSWSVQKGKHSKFHTLEHPNNEIEYPVKIVAILTLFYVYYLIHKSIVSGESFIPSVFC